MNTENYKLSQFNSIVGISNTVEVIYNAYSNRFMLLRKGVMKEHLRDMHGNEDLMENLLKGGFVIDRAIDEVEQVKKLSLEVDNNCSRYNLIINPTLNCNFKCWYCYESKLNKGLMPMNVFQNIKKFLKRSIPLYEEFHLSFFGGEPLLGYKKIVKPLIEYTKELCGESGTKLTISFTSNGYLIRRDMMQFLKDSYVENFQITLDGNRDLHNQIRFQNEGDDSYSTIVKNVKMLLEYNISVTLRINYTDKNINVLKDVAEDLSSIIEQQKSLLFISFHQVWQNANVNLDEEIRDVVEFFYLKGLNASIPIFDNVRNSCYADKRNNALINYNGDIFKCTAVDFENTQRYGFLNDDGSIIWENDSLNIRLNSKFKNEPCLKCRLLPICNGACTQKAIDFKNRDYCIFSFDEEKKDKVILDIFENYIRKTNRN